MPKHTPGPWHVGVRQAHRIIYDAKGWAVADATVYHGKESHDEMMANARLIAEAPAMLEALRACELVIPRDRRVTLEAVRAILARIDGATAEREE